MVVDSPLALFTTLFGWQFYNAIWFTLLGTGVALLPFLGALIEAFITSREDGEFIGSDPVGVYKRVEAKIIIMLLVVGVAAQPSGLTSLTPETITHTPVPTVLNPQPPTQTAASSGTTFDDSGFAEFDGLDQGGVDVPIWWFSVLSVSSGINAAVLAGFPEIESLRDISRLAQATNISDPVVRSEASEFFTHCYLRAKSRFQRENPPGADPVDISWIGSRFFLEEFRINGDGPIIYDFLRARRSIQGFPYNPARDFEWLPEFVPEFGKPTCRQWWLGEATNGREGLRQLLLDQVDFENDGLVDNLTAGILDKIPAGLTPDALEDRLIQAVLTRDPPQISNNSFGESAFEPGDGALQVLLRNLVQPVVTGVGIEVGSVMFSLFIDVVTQVMPMVQPMLLMGIYTVLPFALLASRFSVSFLIVGAFGIFTINFWPVLWHIATWVDDNLLVVLFPASFGEGPPPLLDALVAIRGLVGTAGATKLTLLNMVTASLFLLLPSLFTFVMGWAGLRAASSLSALTSSANNNQAATGAASAPGRMASSAGRSVQSSAVRKITKGSGR